MIKITKKISQREKPNNIHSSKTLKTLKQKSKNTVQKKISSSRQKLNPLKTSKNFIESDFNKKRNHNSISSKEEVATKFLNRPKINKLKTNIEYYNTCGNKNKNNNNKLFTSNLFLTNDTDTPIIEEEKKIKKSKFMNINEDKILNLPEEETIFKKNNYKKTIIIDNEGNNNLHMNLKKGENDYKKILNNKINNKSIFTNSSVNVNTETNSLFTNDSKMEPSKLIFNNNFINQNIIKENEIKKNIIDDPIDKEKNEEDKRINEYNKIFNLLNANIEQFKKMFSSNTYQNKISNPKEKEKGILKEKEKGKEKINQNNNQKNKSKKILIQNKRITQPKKPKNQGSKSVDKNKNNSKESSHSKKSQKNIKKNLSEKNLSSSSKRLKTCQNIFTVDVRNDIEKDLNSDTKIIKNESNNAVSSFLESSIQEDFYQSLINKDFANLMEEDKIMKDDIMSINIDEKGKDENIQDIQDSRIFKAKFENENANEDINKNEGKKDDKTNCTIF